MSRRSDSRHARSCGESTSTPSTSKMAPAKPSVELLGGVIAVGPLVDVIGLSRVTGATPRLPVDLPSAPWRPACVPGTIRGIFSCVPCGIACIPTPTRNADGQGTSARAARQRTRPAGALLRAEIAATAPDTGDDVDDANWRIAKETGRAVSRSLRDRWSALERAEERLQRGTYGRSIASGRPIPDERL